MTACLSLIASVLTPLPKSALLSLGLSAGISAADAAIQKKIYGRFVLWTYLRMQH